MKHENSVNSIIVSGEQQRKFKIIATDKQQTAQLIEWSNLSVIPIINSAQSLSVHWLWLGLTIWASSGKGEGARDGEWKWAMDGHKNLARYEQKKYGYKSQISQQSKHGTSEENIDRSYETKERETGKEEGTHISSWKQRNLIHDEAGEWEPIDSQLGTALRSIFQQAIDSGQVRSFNPHTTHHTLHVVVKICTILLFSSESEFVVHPSRSNCPRAPWFCTI